MNSMPDHGLASCNPFGEIIMRAISLLALVGALVLVSGPTRAQEQRATGAITEARNAAVGFALTMDIVTTSLASTCERASEALSDKSPAALSSWKTRNGQFVDSAHKYLLFVRAVVADQRGEDAGRAFYEEQKTRFFADAKTALTDTFPEGGLGAAGCEQVLTKLGDGSMDLQAKPEFFRALVEIDGAISHMLGR